jgi:ubiquinone biosynthesis protein UbiJ
MFASSLNAYLARALDASPRARELCVALEGRRARIEIEGVPGALNIAASGGALQATPTAEPDDGAGASADITVRTSALGLLAMARNEASEAALRGSITITGDEQLARQFQELARLLRPDLESALGHVAGRIPAHLARRAVDAVALWGQAARESVLRNTADYLAHESRDLVPRAEGEDLYSGIDALRAELVRVEARVAQLADRLGAHAERDSS